MVYMNLYLVNGVIGYIGVMSCLALEEAVEEGAGWVLVEEEELWAREVEAGEEMELEVEAEEAGGLYQKADKVAELARGSRLPVLILCWARM